MAGLYNGLANIGTVSARAGVWASWIFLVLFAGIMPLVILFSKPPPPLAPAARGAPVARHMLQPTKPGARLAAAGVSVLVGVAVFALARFNAKATAASKPYAALRGAGTIADMFLPSRRRYNNTLIDFDQMSFE